MSGWMGFPAIMLTQGVTVMCIALVVALLTSAFDTNKSQQNHARESNETTKLANNNNNKEMSPSKDYGTLQGV